MSAAKIYQFPKNMFPFKLRRIQREAMKFFETVDNKNLLIVAPTGIGKTEIGEMAIRRAIDRGGRGMWLSPLKSDTKEKYDKFILRKYECILDTSDARSELTEYNKFHELIITVNERADSILRSFKKRSIVVEGNPLRPDPSSDIDPMEVSVVVIDEIHNFGSSGRGPTLESFILKLRFLYPHIQIVGLSATIRKPRQVAKWLDAHIITATPNERPVPLTKRVKVFKDMYNHEDNQKSKIGALEQIFDRHEGKQFLVFCTSRKRTRDLAKAYCGIPPKGRLTVKKMLANGYAHHNAGLTLKTRQSIENGFKIGKIKVIFCTPTLAQGINLPADVTVIFDTHFYSFLTGMRFPIDHNSFNQIGGRAGRPGLSDHGYFYSIVTDTEFGAIINRMDNPMIPRSWIWKVLTTCLLEWNVSGTYEDIQTCMKMCEKIYSFDVISGDREFVSREKVESTLKWLIDKKFIMRTNDDITIATDKGRKTAWLMIRPKTAQHFVETADTVRNYNKPEHIFATLMNTEEFLEIIRVNGTKDWRALDLGRQHLNLIQCEECKTLIGFENHPRCPRCDNTDSYKFKVYQLDDRMYKAFALVFKEELEKGVPPKYRKLKLSPTDLSVLKKSVNRLMSAAAILLSNHADIKVIESVALLANAGRLDKKVTELLKVEGIGMTYASRLVNAGIMSVTDFITSDFTFILKVTKAPANKLRKMIASAREYWANS